MITTASTFGRVAIAAAAKCGLITAVVLASSITAAAAVAVTADDICPPASDPCIVSTVVQVDADFPLDFGLRTVRVASGGRFEGTLDLLCGAFETDGPGLWLKLGPNGTPEFATITARRSCSANPSLPCLDDSVCAGASAGVCSEGDGGMRLAGDVDGNSSTITLRAVGDVSVEGRFDASGNSLMTDGGSVEIDSTQGSIEVNADIDVDAGVDHDYGGTIVGRGGQVQLDAAVDVTVRRPIRATGGAAYVDMSAGRDIAIGSSILTQGVAQDASIGGTIDLAAGRDLLVVRIPGESAVMNINGGHETYYGSTAGYPGGYGFLNAGGDIVVGERVRMLGDSGISHYADDAPFAGDWYFESGEDTSFSGFLTSRGKGFFGAAFHGVSFAAGGSITIGRRARITTASAHSAIVSFEASEAGSITIDGRINTRGRALSYYGEGYGGGGDVRVYGGNVSVGGRIETGGAYGGATLFFDVCRLRLESGGEINGSKGHQEGYTGYNKFWIRESMTTEPGSAILGRPASQTSIYYRDAAKPPVLDGTVKPAPVLAVFPFDGCPVCGNSEIDENETCDDGNTVEGDGCNSTCLLEP
ncbi:MAG TPA: hypothetical protein VN634_02700 [Candidatus Limnocylindrales bacterium]|nr:hypothetical protein [Candidatus Limnocylindrales bacterium]